MARVHHLVRIVSSSWSIMFVFWTTSEIVCVCVYRFHVFVFVCQRWRVLLWCAVWMLWAARELLPISSKATARVEVVVAVVVVQAEGVVVKVVQAVGVVVEAKPERWHRSSLSHTCHLQYAHKHTHTCSFFSFWVCRAVRSYSQPLPSEYVHQLHLSYTLSYALQCIVLHTVLRTLLNLQCHEKPRLTKPATPESELRGNFCASPPVILMHYKSAQLWEEQQHKAVVVGINDKV